MDSRGEVVSVDQACTQLISAETALHERLNVSVESLYFRNPDVFRAGGLGRNLQAWVDIGLDKSSDYYDWLLNGVNVEHFFVPFHGCFAGVQYHHCFPPANIFSNSKCCDDFRDFISSEIKNRLKTGAISFWGEVGKSIPPHVVSPLTVEPTKPRLCLNMRYINSWMRDTPFSLDSCKDVPRLACKSSFFTKLDDKSGYDHVLVSENSKTFFGFEWNEIYYVCNTIPFGWKNSAFVYHSLSRFVAAYLRGLGINNLVYIDDRLIERFVSNGALSFLKEAQLAIYATCQLVVRLGYYIGLTKSKLVPSKSLIYLGFEIDSENECFRITEDKLLKFSLLRDSILSSKSISLITLQKFAGKCISFSIAVPGARLFTSECYTAMSVLLRTNRETILIHDDLEKEISFWRFMDDIPKYLPWRRESHSVLTLSSDSSGYRWGAVLKIGQETFNCGDYWLCSDLKDPIHIKEAKALLNTLRSYKQKLRNCRVDALVDNQFLIHAWYRQGSKTPEMNNVLKDIFFVLQEFNIFLKLDYVTSCKNPADKESRVLSKSDTKLSQLAWVKVELAFGPHTWDLMATDSNCMRGRGGLLKHFTPCPNPLSNGVNVFAQIIDKQENCYCFPPFNMILPFLCFVEEQHLICTVVVPALYPAPMWFPKLKSLASNWSLLAYKGDKHALLYPSKNGFFEDKVGLPWNLWMVRLGGIRQSVFSYANWCFCSEHLTSLIVGDSVVRRLPLYVGADTRVVSIPGGYLSYIVDVAISHAISSKCLYLIIHGGINDIMKSNLSIFQTIDSLDVRFSDIIKVGHCTVIFSSILFTTCKNTNNLIFEVNERLRHKCKENSWGFVLHDEVRSGDLVEGIHLNHLGLLKFAKDMSLESLV